MFPHPLKSYRCRTSDSLGAGLKFIFDNALVTQSRLILLDSPVDFLSPWRLFGIRLLHQPTELGVCLPQPLVAQWLPVFPLGATLSVKWVGLFTMAWVISHGSSIVGTVG